MPVGGLPTGASDSSAGSSDTSSGSSGPSSSMGSRARGGRRPQEGPLPLYELAQRRHQPLARAIVDLLRLEGTAQRVREVGGACAAGGQMTRARHVS